MPYPVRDEHGYKVVVLDGDVDLSQSPEARRTILECLDERHDVLVDLSSVSYIDSSGVASLVEGFQSAKKKQLEFGLIGVSEPALAVLKLARLDRVFEIHPSVAARREARSKGG